MSAPFRVQQMQPVPATLDVVAVVSNPFMYASRYRHYLNFEKHMQESGVRLTTVELAQGDREFEVTEAGNPRHLQLRSRHTLWHKENLINLGIARLPSDWQYVAWIDADLTFNRPDWAFQTLHALQHFDIVQPFSHSINMGPDYEPIFDSHRNNENTSRKVVVSWLYAHFNQLPRMDVDTGKRYLRKGESVGCCCTGSCCDCGAKPGASTLVHEAGHNYVWHSGFAWAARRAAITTIGGVLDWAILGSADRHMADMMTGPPAWNPGLSPGYRRMLDIHAGRFAKLNGNFGAVPGLVTHHWHGKLVNRGYLDRWKLLFNHKFDPVEDLFRDEQGLWQLTDAKPGLRDDIRRYFLSRNEDSIDV